MSSVRKGQTQLSASPSLIHARDDVHQVEYLGFPKLFMGDWDFPDASHEVPSQTILHPDYALGILRRDVYQNPSHSWKVYRTPAGVRAFLTSQVSDYDPAARGLARNLWVDPYYQKKTEQAGIWWCRVSPKNGRRGDFVARPWTTVSGSRARELPEALELLQTHDRLCSRRFPFRHVVRIFCRLCPMRNYGEDKKDCPYCGKKGYRDLLVPEQDYGFILAARNNPEDEAPRMIWSDRLCELGQPDEAVEMVRAMKDGSPWSMQEMTRNTPTPRPTVGQFTNWSVNDPWEGPSSVLSRGAELPF